MKLFDFLNKLFRKKKKKKKWPKKDSRVKDRRENSKTFPII